MHFPEVFFGTLREHYIVLFGAAGSVALVAGFVGAWVGAKFGSRSAVRRAAQLSDSNPADKRQIQDVVQALDVLTVEVERMTEGHRFIAKLLAERAEQDRRALLPKAQPLASSHNTPH